MAQNDVPAVDELVLHEADRAVDGWDDERGRVSWRTLFSGDSTPTQRMVTGVADLPEGGFLALHRHAEAETYYVLSGNGVVVLQGAECEVGPGSTVFIPGDGEHGIRNTGAGVLRFFYALAADSFADVEYRFS